MEDVTRCVTELRKAIRNSSVYEEYQQAQAKLNDDPQLKRKVNEFRGKNYQLQNSTGDMDYFTAMEKLEQDYYEIRKHPFASAYLEKELDLCRMVQRISEALVEDLNLDIEGFEDMIF